jgi:hypothetical protein
VGGFEIQIDQLKKAAKAADSAADQARGVKPGAGLDGLPAALRGGSAAAAAPALASAFNERAQGWAGEIDRWGDSVVAAAKAYSDSDESAKAAFGR